MEGRFTATRMMDKLRKMSREELIHEFWQLFRFGIVGALSFALTASLYALFTRVLWPTADRPAMNVLANGICAVFNFLAHQRWTYKAGKIAHEHVRRYIVVIISGLVLNGIGFWIGESLLHIDDRIVFVGVSLLVPIFTYIMHRQFTFKNKHHPTTN